MKKNILTTVLMITLAITTSSKAQIGSFPPRMTEAQRDLLVLTSASAGLTIWCTDCGGYIGELNVYDGFNWGKVAFATSLSADTTPRAKIGTQVWTTQNLNVSRYSDGTSIPQVTNSATWSSLTTGAWCYYNNDPAYGVIYGKLYNWYAVAGIYDQSSLSTPSLRKKLAPSIEGYHISSDIEWTKLTDYLGGTSLAGKDLRANNWGSNAFNPYGFSAAPGGIRTPDGTFNGGVNSSSYSSSTTGTATWWTSTEYDAIYAWDLTMSNLYVTSRNYSNIKTIGMYVRCLKD